MYENRIYAIVDTQTFQAQLTAGNIDENVLFGSVLETDLTTLRYAICGEAFVIKSDDQVDIDYLRTRAAELDIIYSEYDYSQILSVMATSAWSVSGDLL
jgi:hypothetical protein